MMASDEASPMDNDPPAFAMESDELHQPKARKLADIQYVKDGTGIQSFSVDSSHPIDIVQLRVKSNWGHDAFTSLYRVRVHGQ